MAANGDFLGSATVIIIIIISCHCNCPMHPLAYTYVCMGNCLHNWLSDWLGVSIHYMWNGIMGNIALTWIDQWWHNISMYCSINIPLQCVATRVTQNYTLFTHAWNLAYCFTKLTIKQHMHSATWCIMLMFQLYEIENCYFINSQTEDNVNGIDTLAHISFTAEYNNNVILHTTLHTETTIQWQRQSKLLVLQLQ